MFVRRAVRIEEAKFCVDVFLTWGFGATQVWRLAVCNCFFCSQAVGSCNLVLLVYHSMMGYRKSELGRCSFCKQKR